MSSDVELFFCRQLGSYFYGKIQCIRVYSYALIYRWLRFKRYFSYVSRQSFQREAISANFFFWFVNEFTRIFNYVYVFFYDDDMKFFNPVHGFQGCMKI
jgi:hypothetical protein